MEVLSVHLDDSKTTTKACHSNYQARIAVIERSILGAVHRPQAQLVTTRDDPNLRGCGRNAQPNLGGFLSRLQTLELLSRGR
jgi:hypothetical protein